MSDDVLDGVPADVCELLSTSIESIEKLEILLYAARHAHRWWTVAELAQATGFGRGDTALAAQDLLEDGLLARDVDRVRFAPRPATRGATVATLLLMYDADRLHLLAVMNELALERVRTSAAAAFLRRTGSTRRIKGDDGDGAG